MPTTARTQKPCSPVATSPASTMPMMKEPATVPTTEAWPPNVLIAGARLESLGIQVVQVDPARDNTGRPIAEVAAKLPFPDGSFHLVVDRHESFVVTEVARILVRGGTFITQQVDAGNDREYRALSGIEEPEPDPTERWESWMPHQLERAGLHVIEHASAPFVQKIHDVGALAYELKAIAWMVPDFSIAKYRNRLRELQAVIDRDGPLVVRQRRFFARAEKL